MDPWSEIDDLHRKNISNISSLRLLIACLPSDEGLYLCNVFDSWWSHEGGKGW